MTLFGAAWPQATLRRSRFAELDGFATDARADAWAVLVRQAQATLDGDPALRAGRPATAAWRDCCGAITRYPGHDGFEALFEPWHIDLGDGTRGFFTAYYEPELDGALSPSAAFSAPVFARPDDLVSLTVGEVPPNLAGLQAARRRPDGGLDPFADRAAITADPARYTPLVWLRDPIEAFMVHVQGSARVRLPDGSVWRLSYAGRNGHPYTSIGRLLVTEHQVPLAAMTLDVLKEWVRQHGQGEGQAGAALMNRNASFIFFRFDPLEEASLGPTGGSGLALTPFRSIAIDRTLWPYGLPFFVHAELPWERDEPTPFRRLTVAEDTGSAIVGPARLDLFLGSGAVAGRRAGQVRHRGDLWVLLPRGFDPAAVLGPP